MKKIYLIIAVLIILSLVYGAFYFGRPLPEVSNTATTTPITGNTNDLVSIAPLVTENASSTYAEMSLSYPKSSSTQLKEIFELVQKVKNDFWGQYGSLTPAQAEEMYMRADNPYQLFVGTHIATSTKTVTYIIQIYEFFGGAHGGTSISTFTYDTKGKLITAMDVFTENYLSVLSTMSRQYFYETMAEYAQPDVIDSGTEPNTDNFASWYLTDENLTLIFGQYQVGPYVLGIQEYSIQKSKIQSILKPNFR